MAVEVELRVWGLDPRVITPSERLVLANLAWHAHKDGRNAYPATRTIARETSLTRRAVQKILQRLRQKGFLTADGVIARGAVRYTLNLNALDRERYSLSKSIYGEQGSPTAEVAVDSTADDGDRGSCRGEREPQGRANAVHKTGEPHSPDPSLNRHSELSLKKNTGARAPASHKSSDESEQNHRLLKRLAFEALESLGLDARFGDLTEQLKQLAAQNRISYDSASAAAAVTFAMYARKSGLRAVR